jgi:hypothetical protein
VDTLGRGPPRGRSSEQADPENEHRHAEKGFVPSVVEALFGGEVPIDNAGRALASQCGALAARTLEADLQGGEAAQDLLGSCSLASS